MDRYRSGGGRGRLQRTGIDLKWWTPKDRYISGGVKVDS